MRAVRTLSVVNRQKSVLVDVPLLRQRTATLLSSAVPAPLPALAVTVVSDAFMRRLHRQYRGVAKNATTLACEPPLASVAAVDQGDIWLGAGAVQRRSEQMAQTHQLPHDVQSWFARVRCAASRVCARAHSARDACPR